MRASKSSFQSYKSKQILYFANLICSSVSGPNERKKKSVCILPYLVTVESYGMFGNSIGKISSVCTKIALIEKIFQNWQLADSFLLFICQSAHCQNLAFRSLHCPLQVKKLIQENSVKYVNQTVNFHFRPKHKTAISLPIFNLFQLYLFYFRDFIWIIT